MSATPPYSLYGLALESALDLPCPRARAEGRGVVRLAPTGAAGFARWRPRTARARRDWFYCRRSRTGTTYLRWADLFEFLVSADGRDIRYRGLPHATDESLSAYLLGQVLSFSLLAFGVEPLHGTAVVVDGRAVGFLGGCGRGKSTLGAAFLGRGYPLLTDDLMALERTRSGYTVHPGMPRIKLFPSVAQRLLGVARGASRLNDGTTKQILPLEAGAVAAAPVALRALYVLDDRDDRRAGRPGSGAIAVTPLSAGAACLQLVRSTFNTIVVDRDRLARQFAFASRVAAAVPVRRLAYPRSLSRLPAVCEAVLADLP